MYPPREPNARPAIDSTTGRPREPIAFSSPDPASRLVQLAESASPDAARVTPPTGPGATAPGAAPPPEDTAARTARVLAAAAGMNRKGARERK